ncbi:MAG TPA: VOC family protein [Thermoanaerobaculia bacterium]|jgi:predicted enzyme related to lactoylglutathione lyase|nr:VOC family protein [Thermoanaerobaculia bacterium]
MPAIEKYEPGMFCWIELATNDAAAAKTFYTSLFGWTANDMPMPEGVYTMWQKNSHDLGAMYQSKDIPPNWASYISVENVDESAKKAQSLGANVVAPPFDVMDVGRMAVVADPQGATFCLWQAKKHIGATIRDEANTLCWNELMTSDIAAARDFYKGLFGWNLELSPQYTEVHVGPVPVGGMMQITPDMMGTPPNWAPYFSVDDCDAAVAKAKSLGAQIYVPPTDIPNVGRFAVIADPQGAMFDVIKLSRM